MQELVGSSSSDRNWKGIAIAIGVIILVLCGVGISVVLMTPPDSGPRVKGLRFSIKHILDYKFKPRKFNGTWVSGMKICLDEMILNLIIKVIVNLITYHFLRKGNIVFYLFFRQ